MYLVSPEYADKKPKNQSQLKSESRNNIKSKHGRGKKNKKSQHPYDKWVNMRHQMQETAIDRKTLIQ